MSFVDDLKAKLAELEDGDAFAQEFKRIEDQASLSPWLHASPYNLRQFELLLKPYRERARKNKPAKSFSFAKSAAVSVPPLPLAKKYV
jgi:hypothetical protein